jgi:hypothetical protein
MSHSSVWLLMVSDPPILSIILDHICICIITSYDLRREGKAMVGME